MSFFDDFSDHINIFFSTYKNGFDCIDTMHNVSKDESQNLTVYLIDDPQYNNMEVISMDSISQNVYNKYKNATTKHVPNTVDAFLIDKENVWYFIEFKNSDLSSNNKKIKDNIEKKGLNNLMMIMDIMKNSPINNKIQFDNDNPLKFIREYCVFIVVVSKEKNSFIESRVRDEDKLSRKYVPDFLEKYNEFYFKEAYIYTEDYFINRVLKKFKYS